MVEKHSDRFAFQQDGHFFCRKEGETLNQNWIVENLNNAFSTWNGKLTELWGLVTTSPQTFKGGAVWGVMQSLHNAMIGKTLHYTVTLLILPTYSKGASAYGRRSIQSNQFAMRFCLYPAPRDTPAVLFLPASNAAIPAEAPL